MNTLPQDYVDALKRHGRNLKDAGVNGVALPRKAALEAIGILRRTNVVAILGGEVFQVRDGKAELSYDNWDTKSSMGPNSTQYRLESYQQAETFVSAYHDAEDGTIFYRIVTGLERVSS